MKKKKSQPKQQPIKTDGVTVTAQKQMDNITTIEIFKTLEAKVGEDTASKLVDFIEQQSKVNTADLATKDFLKKEIADAKNVLVLYMFGFWIGQVAVIAGLLVYFFTRK